MVRDLIPYINGTAQGYGLEGLLNWSNSTMDNLLIPIFLIVFYALAISLATKNEYQLGGQVFFISLVFFILGMIAQTFTPFNQLVMFGFAIGIMVGIVMSYIENARN